jgi:hypothetical protein
MQEEAKEILSKAPGVTLIDDRSANRFPTPLDVSPFIAYESRSPSKS